MANRLEMTVWDAANNDVKEQFQGSSARARDPQRRILTDTILESHRLNSPYLLEGDDKAFLNTLRTKMSE